MVRALVAAALPLIAAAAGSASHPAPVVFWSDKVGSFGEMGSARSVVQGSVAEWVSSHVDSELLVVLDFPSGLGVASGLAGAPAIREAVEAAKAGAVAPLVAAGESPWAMVAGERLVAASWEDAVALISGRQDLSTNGRCDAIVVKASGTIDLKERFGVLSAAASGATRGSVSFALVTETQAALTPEFIKAMTSGPTVARRLSTSTSDSPKKYVHMTPDLLAGLLTGIMLVVIALIGLSCLSGIQTPSQFTSKPPPSSREY